MWKLGAIIIALLGLLLVYVNKDSSPVSSVGTKLETLGLEIHGKFCGPNPGGSIPDEQPVDWLDAICKQHDRCYEEHGYFFAYCDDLMVDSIREHDGWKDHAKALLAYTFIKNSPCWMSSCEGWLCHTCEVSRCEVDCYGFKNNAPIGCSGKGWCKCENKPQPAPVRQCWKGHDYSVFRVSRLEVCMVPNMDVYHRLCTQGHTFIATCESRSKAYGCWKGPDDRIFKLDDDNKLCVVADPSAYEIMCGPKWSSHWQMPVCKE